MIQDLRSNEYKCVFCRNVLKLLFLYLMNFQSNEDTKTQETVDSTVAAAENGDHVEGKLRKSGRRIKIMCEPKRPSLNVC